MQLRPSDVFLSAASVCESRWSPRKLADCGLGETVVVKPDTSTLAELMQTHHILLLPGRFSPRWLDRGMASGMAVFSAPIGLAAETSRQQTQLAAPADASRKPGRMSCGAGSNVQTNWRRLGSGHGWQ